jgi:hypothetical protein
MYKFVNLYYLKKIYIYKVKQKIINKNSMDYYSYIYNNFMLILSYNIKYDFKNIKIYIS